MIEGYDISAHQDGFDVAGNGDPFIIIKQTEGVSWPDKDSQHDTDVLRGFREQARGHTLVGLYHYAHPGRNSATDEANHFINFVGDLRDNETIILDLEENHGGNVEDWCIEWLDVIEARYPSLRGKVILYSGTSYLGGIPTGRLVQRMPILWVASYFNDLSTNHNPGTDRWDHYTFWQYTNKPLDRSVFIGSEEDLRALGARPSGHVDPPVSHPDIALRGLSPRCSNLTLDAAGNGTAPGTGLIQWGHGGGDNQKFVLQWVRDDLYRIVCASNGLVFDIAGVSQDNGATVWLWPYTGGDNQLWRVQVTDGFGVITSALNGKALDIPAGRTDWGAPLTVWDRHGGPNQQFYGTLANTPDMAPLVLAAPAPPPPPAPPATPTSGPDIGAAQAYVDGLNFYLGGTAGFQEAFADYDLAIDGVMGPITAAAVQTVAARGGRLSANFHIDEFRCTHCGRARVNRALVRLCQRVRDKTGPLSFDSSYRCENHPLSHGSFNSQHTWGCAVDPSPDCTVQLARDCGASGIGYAAADKGRCTHFDVRGEGPYNPSGGRPGNPTMFQDN